MFAGVVLMKGKRDQNTRVFEGGARSALFKAASVQLLPFINSIC
jgi:hypothetical protein